MRCVHRRAQGDQHMNIGVTAQAPPESRVAATPETVTKLAALGYDVAVETGAGAASRFPDEAYIAAGARIVDADTAWGSDVVLTVNPPAESQLDLMRDGGALIGLLAPAQNPEYVAELAKRNITALALDAEIGRASCRERVLVLFVTDAVYIKEDSRISRALAAIQFE